MYKWKIGNEKDIESIIKLYINAFSKNGETIYIDKLKKDIDNHLKNGYIILALDDFSKNKIVGYTSGIVYNKYSEKSIIDYIVQNSININDNDIFRTSTVVDDNFKGKGIGDFLLKVSIQYYLDNFKNRELFTRSRVDNKIINYLLIKYNFKKIFKGQFITNGIVSDKYIWKYIKDKG